MLVFWILTAALSLGGCAGQFNALDQAVADMAARAEDKTVCRNEPALGAGPAGGRTCTFSHVVHETTSTTTTTAVTGASQAPEARP